ncbi:GMC oxidoreductase [uncultured Friedmanniella sp.]|uniref:GMC oxidoreductase n=1 Tax=uncultured Friedmanniella sp. TaxID=335381 RepID=UPI0035CA2C50
MPMIDLLGVRGDGPTALAECDVCIVGTGPAGATLAQELSATRLRVTVLESGDGERSEPADRLNDIENVGRPRVPDQWSVRNRIVGGSSHTWGGRCAPFDEIDYQQRSWVPGSGWPFGPEEMEPYLDRTTSHLGLAVGTGFSDESFWSIAGRTPPAARADPSLLRSFFWQFSRDEEESYPFEYVRFGRSLARRLGPDVTLVTGATVLRVLPSEPGDAVSAVEYVAPDGHRRTLRTGTVVLATGGIENARILLSSDSTSPAGLGNDHDQVGRYLMDHPRGPVGSFDVAASHELLKRLGRYNVRGHLFRAGLRLSPEVQQAEGLLNCAAWLGEELGPDDPWDALRRFIQRKPALPADALALAKGVPLFVRGLRDYFVDRNGIPRRFQAVTLLAMVEQRPDPESRITLGERRDAFGIRLPRVDWRIHPDEVRTMRRTAEIVGQQLVAMGFPAPTPAAWVLEGGDLPASFVDVAHPTGTTRMSVDPRQGVVDSDGQVHGVRGLYVTGSSVFPTVGHCNPTQMIVAMAIRLADHLKAKAVPVTTLTTRGGPVPARRAEPATVLVTGGTGRIGQVVVADLLERGYLVRCTTSRASLPEPVPGLEWRSVDFMTAAAGDYDDLVHGCSAVLHLAAEIGKQDRMPTVNGLATRLLAGAAERAGVEAFVYTSTVSVYGSGRARTMTEDAPTLTVEDDVPGEYLAMDYVRTYGRTKLAGERAISEVAERTRYTVLRPTVVVDEQGLAAIQDWSRSKRVLAAHRHAHHVYVRDVSDALVWAMERSLRGSGEAGSGEAGSVETFNVSEDHLAAPTHAAFLRKAFDATGDPRFKVPVVPGAVDWLHDIVRFRQPTLRNPLWRMRFPADKLAEAGFRARYGMRRAEAGALELLRQQHRPPLVDRPDDLVLVSAGQRDGT